ncbi:MAG: class I SAM-dependent methyltransferase [Firmicutes bacterium]|nr:class I SAM-dependent methyltransferase [Bacillota bacterium]
MNREEIINNHYNNYSEDDRFTKDNYHSLEYTVSKTYFDKYIKPGDRILEVGAGTGAYSLYYANKGYKVNAIEFVEHNLNILKSKIADNMDIVAEQGDAVNLSRFEDNTFDVTLVLGPLYHLYEDNEINKAISEAIRVTKKNGIIALAYITTDGVFASWAIDHLIDGYPKSFDDNFKLVREPEEIFGTFYIQEFKDIMSKFNVTLLNSVATDGIAPLMEEKINALSEEEFKVWEKYQLSVCEREDLQGYSCHMLYICKKN